MPSAIVAAGLAAVLALGCGSAAEPEKGAAAAAPAPVEARLDELAAALPDLLERAGVPGLSLAVVRDGELLWARGFGSTTAAAGGRAVDADTVFAAASLTKPVVAYAALKMVEAGEVELDRPLADYLEYEDLAHDPRAARITARMVLSHSTGLPNWRPGRWTDDPEPLTTQFEPGSRWQYSGEGFVYLQRVVERLAGTTLAELLAERVFEPLAMTRSSLVWQDRFEANYALPHRADLTPREDRRPREPLAAGTLQTTARDYARFLVAVLDGEGLDAATHAAILTPQVEVGPRLAWGLGWGLQESAAGRAIWQWGHDPGSRAFVMGLPASRFGMVFFANSDNGMLLLRRLVEATLGDEDQPALDHLDYDGLDSPRRLLALELERAARDGGAAAVEQRYRRLAADWPEAPFGENVLNRLGYDLLGAGRVDEAVAVFRLNVEAYPEASNPHDSLGEAYMTRGDRELAIASYERSLELDPGNANAAAMLEKLRAEP